MGYQLLKNPLVIALTAFAGGTGVGYFLGSRRRQVEIVTRYIQPSTDEFKEDPNQLKLDWQETPEGLHYQEIIEDEGYMQITDIKVIERVEQDPAPTPEPFIKFNGEGDWDYETEIASRPEDGPYIISVEEYAQNEHDFYQTEIIYYAGDNILTDEHQTPIPHYENVVGELKFGHGSNDANIVFVRNPKMKMEWEIIYDRGTYQEEVLGMEVEKAYPSDLRHSGHGVRRFKLKDH